MANHATFAALLTEKLKVGRQEGKKGSQKPVELEEESRQAFEQLKGELAKELMLFQPDPDQPFAMHVDS